MIGACLDLKMPQYSPQVSLVASCVPVTMRDMKHPAMLLAATRCAGRLRRCTRRHGHPTAALNALVEEYFERQLELSPMNATAIGDSRYDDRLDESTSPGFREKALRHRARLPRSGARASTPRGCRPPSRITYDIFVSEREQALAGPASFPRSYMPLNQMSGLPMDLAVYGSGTGPQPFATAQDYDRFLEARARIPALGRRRHRA